MNGSDIDWARIEAMDDAEATRRALADPDNPPLETRTNLERVVNVLRLRERLGLSREDFAAAYAIPLDTLVSWEERRRYPDAPARAYLRVIAGDPERIAKLVAA